jgi:hypothetical protein
MPKPCAARVFAVTAAKCSPVREPTERASHARTLFALVSVSWVENVFETTIARVVSGSSPASTASTCAPSTFDMKCTRGALAA